MRTLRVLGFVAAMSTTFACGTAADQSESDLTSGDNGDPEAQTIVAAAETAPARAFTSSSGQFLQTTEHVAVRTSPRANASAVRVLPKGSIVNAVTGGSGEAGYLKVSGNGATGWVYTNYLVADPGKKGSGGAAGGGEVDVNGEASPSVAIARAEAAMGFSYYWGGGAWPADGVTDAIAGSCSGSCPSCRHKGKFGADCSGLVAKAWKFGAEALDENSHPFGTGEFVEAKEGHWSIVSRDEAKKADAFVYRSGDKGHIVLYERGDAWGSPVVYECKSCAAGCVYNARTLGSAYKAIRREGF